MYEDEKSIEILKREKALVVKHAGRGEELEKRRRTEEKVKNWRRGLEGEQKERSMEAVVDERTEEGKETVERMQGMSNEEFSGIQNDQIS